MNAPKSLAESLAGPSRDSAGDEPEGRTIVGVSVVKQPDGPALVVLPPEEALRSARPLPSVEELTIEGLTSDEWNALNRVLAER